MSEVSKACRLCATLDGEDPWSVVLCHRPAHDEFRARTFRVAHEYCSECRVLIDASGMCSYGCKFDFDVNRPPHAVVRRVLEVTEVLIA